MVVKIGQEKKKTTTHKEGGKKPRWNEVFVFRSNAKKMEVTVYDEDTFTDDTVGSATIDLDTYFDGQEHKCNELSHLEYFSLLYKGKSAGKIYMSIKFDAGTGNGASQGWGQPANNTSGWGQFNNTSGWGQPAANNNTSGWGKPAVNNNTSGWGQTAANNSWGQPPSNNPSGWGQPVANNNTGWGQGNQANQGWGQAPSNNGWGQKPANNGWGQQPQQANNGWGNPPQPANNGWGNPPPSNNSGTNPYGIPDQPSSEPQPDLLGLLTNVLQNNAGQSSGSNPPPPNNQNNGWGANNNGWGSPNTNGW